MWVFFSGSGRMNQIRLDPPFAGSIGGVKIGDPRSVLLEKLGAPKQKVAGPPNDPAEGYLYDVPGAIARFDFDKADNIHRIRLFHPSTGDILHR